MDLQKLLTQLFGRRPLVVLGVGSELRGDDAWAYDLISRIKEFVPPDVHCIWGATMPENFIKPITRINPVEVLICDAGEFGAVPGTFKIFTPEEVRDETIFTHRLPIKLLATQLKSQTNCSIHLLILQPENLEFSVNLSVPVKKMVNKLVKRIKNILK